jgi:hypothetical protein
MFISTRPVTDGVWLAFAGAVHITGAAANCRKDPFFWYLDPAGKMPPII